MTQYDTAQPRIAVYMIVERDGKCAFVLRSNTGWRDGYYGLPAGRVEKQESYTQAAIREAKEEVGIDVQPQDLEQLLTSHRDEEGSDWVDVVFKVHAYTGEPHNAEPHMHSELAWFSLDALPEKLTPNQKLMLAAIADGKRFIEIGWAA